jgi:hypothetical protein
MADDSLLPLSGDEKLTLVAGLKRLIDEDRYPLSSAAACSRGCPIRFNVVDCFCHLCG